MELVNFRERVGVPVFANETVNLEPKHVKRVSWSLENLFYGRTQD